MSAAFQCRSCGSAHGALVLDLGVQPLANNLLRKEDIEQPEPRFPLRLFVCRSCWLLQIGDLVPPVKLFSEYLYFSSFSDAMLRHAREAAERYIRDFHLGADSHVIEIASNDGYLLQNFCRAGIPCLGIEPAANIARVAREKGVDTLVEFFGEQLAVTLANEGREADLVLGNNVFAHAPHTNDFVAGLRAILKPSGRAVLEFPYAVDFIQRTEFDTIYHEHVFYFALAPLLPLFARHGLEVFHVEKQAIHGGSLRLFVGHADANAIDSSVEALAEDERAVGIGSMEFYEGFAARANDIRESLVELVKKEHAGGKRIAAYGASAKGSTLLNFCGLGADAIDFVADRSTYKQGRFTPGMHIPIVASEELAARMPDFTLLLTWNFADEILEQQKGYRDRGGTFVIPIPKVSVI